MAEPGREPKTPRVVIVGAGFGGLAAAKGLAAASVEVTLIDRRNYHLFQPLLYQVATAALSPGDIAAPIRGIFRHQGNCTVVLARVQAIDEAARHVVTDRGIYPYDFLILATGARHAYFGHDEWEAHARGIKTIDDATLLRHKILSAFERAETEPDAAERDRLLTFVVVGGGPTGVEVAGSVAELRNALADDFRNIDPRRSRIVLVEAGPRLLPSFDQRLGEHARGSLESLGVEVLTGRAVTACDAGGVELGGERLDSRTVVWAAGVRASSAGKWIGAETDPAGRVRVAPDLSVPGRPDIFVVGDTAHVPGADGGPLPGVAPVAKQQGRHVAKLIRRQLNGEARQPFRYRDPGALATIGRNRAVAEFRGVRLTGFPAWLVWSLAHIYFLIGFRNRLSVALSWAWYYVTAERGTRLITGPVAPTERGPPGGRADGASSENRPVA